MGILTAFEWMSTDGIYDAASMGHWWEPYDSESRQKCIIDTYRQVDAFLMGRNTHDLLGPYWGGLPDNAMGGVAGKLTNTPKYVVSSTPTEKYWPNTFDVNGQLEPAVKRLKSEYEVIVVIGSATLVEALCQAELIDEFKFLVQPAIVGTGSRFFRGGIHARLKIVESSVLDLGVQSVHYKILYGRNGEKRTI